MMLIGIVLLAAIAGTCRGEETYTYLGEGRCVDSNNKIFKRGMAYFKDESNPQYCNNDCTNRCRARCNKDPKCLGIELKTVGGSFEQCFKLHWECIDSGVIPMYVDDPSEDYDSFYFNLYTYFSGVGVAVSFTPDADRHCWARDNYEHLTDCSSTHTPTGSGAGGTSEPSVSPSLSPSASPSTSPTLSPSFSPTLSPSFSPTLSPTFSPSVSPSLSPITPNPTTSPTTSRPTTSPTTSRPTQSPTTSRPTRSPTTRPTAGPTIDCEAHNADELTCTGEDGCLWYDIFSGLCVEKGFTKLGNGHCRYNQKSSGNFYTVLTNSGHIDHCFRKCRDTVWCKGIEYNNPRCELWNIVPNGRAGRSSRRTCWVRDVFTPITPP